MSDLISKSALIKKIEGITVHAIGIRSGKGVLSEWMNRYRENVLAAIREEPTIEAVPVVHAEWIKQKPNPDVMKRFHDMGIGKGMSENSIYWTCSNCGNWGTPNHKFCSNCGADMRKGGAE